MSKSAKIAAIAAISILIVIAAATFRLLEEKRQTSKSLEAFALLTQADPIFWGNALNPDSLDAAIKNLEASESKFYQLAKSQGIKEKRILWWPLSFLKTLPDVGRAHVLFLKEPNAKNGQNLIFQYEKALNAYKNEINQLETAAGPFISSDNPDPTFKELAFNLPLFKKNISALEEEIKQRKECLATNKRCELNLTSLELIKAPDKFPERLPESLLFPKEEDFLIRQIVRVPSECWKPLGSDWQEFYVVEHKIANSKEILLKLASENLYARTFSEETMQNRTDKVPEDDREHEKLRNAGLPISYVNDGRFKRCGDLSHYPKALTTLAIYSELKEMGGIVNKLDETHFNRPMRPLISAAKTQEKALMAGKTPSWDQIIALGKTYQAIIEAATRREISLEKQTLEKIIAIRSSISSQLAGFDEILNSLAIDFRERELDWLGRAGILSEYSGLSERLRKTVYFPITYLTFSSSGWRISDQPRYLGTPFPLYEENGKLVVLPLEKVASREALGGPAVRGFPAFVTYSQIKHLFSQNELIDIGRKSYDFYKK
jgi:hypothetical protein